MATKLPLKKDTETEVTGPSKRSLARLTAVQILYQYEYYKHIKTIEELTKETMKYHVSNEYIKTKHPERLLDKPFMEELVSGVATSLDPIGAEIAKHLKDEWTVAKLPDVMKQIIRLAVFELKYMKDIPVNVIINEYVDIAGAFYEENKAAFVNGILDSIAKGVRNE